MQKHFLLFIIVCIEEGHTSACQGVHVEVRGQLMQIDSPLPPFCGSLDSGGQQLSRSANPMLILLLDALWLFYSGIAHLLLDLFLFTS